MKNLCSIPSLDRFLKIGKTRPCAEANKGAKERRRGGGERHTRNKQNLINPSSNPTCAILLGATAWYLFKLQVGKRQSAYWGAIQRPHSLGGWKRGKVGKGEDGLRSKEVVFFLVFFFLLLVSLSSDLGKKTGTSGVQKSGMGKTWEDEYMIISYTKERRAKRSPHLGTRVWQGGQQQG